jgi:hypothetical protein
LNNWRQTFSWKNLLHQVKVGEIWKVYTNGAGYTVTFVGLLKDCPKFPSQDCSNVISSVPLTPDSPVVAYTGEYKHQKYFEYLPDFLKEMHKENKQ